MELTIPLGPECTFLLRLGVALTSWSRVWPSLFGLGVTLPSWARFCLSSQCKELGFSCNDPKTKENEEENGSATRKEREGKQHHSKRWEWGSHSCLGSGLAFLLDIPVCTCFLGSGLPFFLGLEVALPAWSWGWPSFSFLRGSGLALFLGLVVALPPPSSRGSGRLSSGWGQSSFSGSNPTSRRKEKGGQPKQTPTRKANQKANPDTNRKGKNGEWNGSDTNKTE